MAITIAADGNLMEWEAKSSSSNSMPTSTATKTFTLDASGYKFRVADTVQCTAISAAIPTGIIGTVNTASISSDSLIVSPNNSVPTTLTLCGVYGQIWSKTTVVNGTGTKTFGIAGEPEYLSALTPGLPIRIHSRVAPFTNFMVGTVTSAISGTLVTNITGATGGASLLDWIICQDGTFDDWDITPQWGDILNINGSSTLSITQTPKTPHKFVNALTNGTLLIKNTSTTNVLYYKLNEPGSTNSGSDERFEQNSQIKVEGDWISLGTGDGTANQTLSLPTGYCTLPSAIEIEISGGSGNYRQWKVLPKTYSVNCDNNLSIMPKTMDTPPISAYPIGNCIWHDGNVNTIECGDNINGVVFPNGANIRIPNIVLLCKEYAPVVLQTQFEDTTSSSSVTLGTGSKSFTVGTGLSYASGRPLRIERVSNPDIRMIGLVTSYDSGTGALVVNIATSNGTAGTYDDWRVLDSQSFVISDVSANSGTTLGTNCAIWFGGERIIGTRTGNTVTCNRNSANGRNITTPTLGMVGYLQLTSTTSGSGPGVYTQRFDFAPSGTMDFDKCVVNYRISGQFSDFSLVKWRHVGWNGYISFSNSQGSVDLEDYAIVNNGLLASQTNVSFTSILGEMKEIRGLYYCNARFGVAFVNHTNCPSVTVNDVEACNFDRKTNGINVFRYTSCGFATTPKNLYMIGYRLAFNGCSNFEVEDIYIATDPDGNSTASAMQHLECGTSLNFVMRKIRGIGPAKLSTSSLLLSDTLSFGGIIHDVDFSTENNATPLASVCALAGTNFVYANMNFGSTSTTFANTQNRSTSGLVEKNVMWRNVLSTTAGTTGSATGIPYSSGIRVENSSFGQMRWSSAGTTVNPSYKDCANFYTFVDYPYDNGRLCIGAVSAELTKNLYDLTGTTYVNNDGRVYLEGDGDSIILKSVFSIKNITSFRNDTPIIRSVNGGALSYDFRTCHWGENINDASWQTLDATNLSAVVVEDANEGIDFQLRITGSGVVAGRYFEQILVYTNNNPAYSPPTTETTVGITNAVSGSIFAVLTDSNSLIGYGTVGADGTKRVDVPVYADGIIRTVNTKLRKYGYEINPNTTTYYRDPVLIAASQILDTKITQSDVTVVSGYSTLETLDKFYDYSQYYISTHILTPPFAIKLGSDVYLDGYSLTINPSASQVFNLSGNNITIKAHSLASGTNFTSFTTDISAYLLNGATINCTYTENGTTYRYATATVSGFLSGSRIQIYNDTTDTEVYNQIVYGTSWTQPYTDGTLFSAGDSVRVRIAYQNGITATIAEEYSVIASSTGWTIVDDISYNTVYASYGVDGYTCDISGGGEFRWDGANLQIDIDDVNNVTEIQRIGAWWVYYVTTEEGIRTLFGALNWTKINEIEIDSTVCNLKLDNRKATPLKVIGGRIYRTDDATVIADTSQSIQIDFAPVYAISTGGSSLTPEEKASLAKIESLTSLIPAVL